MTQIEQQPAENTQANGGGISEMSRKPFRITMELPLFLTMMSLSLSNAAIRNLILYRTCFHALDYPKAQCVSFLSLDKTNKTSTMEQEAQEYATWVFTCYGVMTAVVPAILTCFVGVWSNTHGRKPLVEWPLLGLAMSSILMVGYSIIGSMGPWWYLLTAIPHSLSGGLPVLSTGVFCYVADISSTEKRSLRIMILGVSGSLGDVIGSIASPHVLRALGLVYLLILTAVLQVVAYIYTKVWIQESLKGAVQGTMLSMIDPLFVKQMIGVCFKRRSGTNRTQILLLVLVNSLAAIVASGTGLEYFYTRAKLQWTLQDYTNFAAVHTTIEFFGGFFGIGVIQRMFKVADLTLINVAFISSVVENSFTALATQTWHMYLGSVVSLFRGLSNALLLSLFTKILPQADIAKMIALLQAIQGVWSLIIPVVFNSLYAATLSTFPAAIYVLTIGISIICFVCTGIVHYYRWNVLPHQQRFDN